MAQFRDPTVRDDSTVHGTSGGTLDDPQQAVVVCIVLDIDDLSVDQGQDDEIAGFVEDDRLVWLRSGDFRRVHAMENRRFFRAFPSTARVLRRLRQRFHA
jgi:hypothetical protein